MSQLSYCNAHERASSWPTPVLDGCSSAYFTFITTCTWTKLLRDETLLLDDRCPAVLPGVLGSPSMRSFSATRTPDQTALTVEGSLGTRLHWHDRDIAYRYRSPISIPATSTRSQAGLYSLSASYYRLHSFPGRPRRHAGTQVHVRYARTQV